MIKELTYPFDASFILRKKHSLKKQLVDTEIKTNKKIAILCGSTVGELQDIIELFLLNNGIKPTFWQGDYNRYYEEALFPPNELAEFNPDIIYIHTSIKNIIDFPAPFESDDSCAQKLEHVQAKYEQIWESLYNRFRCPIIQNNFELPQYRVMGNADGWQSGGICSYINQLNFIISRKANEKEYLYINDINYLSSYYGLSKWFNNLDWYSYKYPFARDLIPDVAYNLYNIMKSLWGYNKKSVVVDLDNTLWGGVIGDVGVDNIFIGTESPIGMAYSDFQSYLKKLSQLGVSLSICSKNEESIAKEGFNHPASILKYDDFIIKKINWENKDQNIYEIAKEINIFPDAIVFLDDNPAERDLVKALLPTISTLNLSRPEEYVSLLDQAGFFETTILSQDDKNRNDYYRANQQRDAFAKSFTSYNDYLNSLNMVCCIKKFDTALERVTQLINKTNQFNLTTRRFAIDEVKEYISQNTITFCGSLSDKFGENGIVSCIMGTIQGDSLHIDLWIMSCRVFKRNLEFAMFDALVKICKKKNLKNIYGYYNKTAKNELVKSFYTSLGFDTVECDSEKGVYIYSIPEEYVNKNTVMEVSYE